MTKYMLITYYEGGEACDVPITEWPPGDIKAHIQFQHDLNAALTASGELVGADGLAGPDQARFVVAGGGEAPVVTDGPFAESKEFLAGYRIVEVASQARAVEIAAMISAAPGNGGVPVRQRVEVREVVGAPET